MPDAQLANLPPCSHPERLDEDFEGERPEFVPEAMWPHLKRDMILSRAGVLKDSNEQLAGKYGLKVGQVRHLLQSRKWRADFEATRQDLVSSHAVAGMKLDTMFHEKLNDEERMAKVSALDIAKMRKLNNDAMLNLSNGTATGSTIGTLNFADIKAMVNVNIKKPGEGAGPAA